MSSFEIFQISDPHLSPARPQFVPNFEIARDLIDGFRPDLVVCTGDLTVEAPDRPAELEFARQALDSLRSPRKVIPGNHDVGDNPDAGHAPERPVCAEWLAAYERVFGDGRWVMREAAWTLIGLNAQLFNSGLPQEAAQLDWLADRLDGAAGPVAIFCHKPLFCEVPDETPALRPFFVPTATRPALVGLLRRADVRLFASGHVHQGRDRTQAGVRHVWAPPVSFVLPDAMQPRYGTKACGLVRYRFTPDALAVEMLYPEQLMSPAEDIVAQAYAA
ncbi:metallophosphoesterase [Rhodobacteraceae bacterium 2CG4]|uniref:Metallophosphoesterase n=1 Tax=Halovulum marinum TaxID=2662447 RepID=A0A6L5Z2T9_9RHOB|nr:metallophosphoesterase [Halovulum marinum]MSU90589.1 metallophosphoesterase [Halovulum marinum]